MTKLISLSSLALALLAQSSFALSLPLPDVQMTKEQYRTLVPTTETQEFTPVNFRAIVALSNCSGSLVRFQNSKLTDAAMVLTNGHCNENGFVDAGKAVQNIPSHRRFGLLSDSGSNLTTLHANLIMFGTMTGTDITLYRLEETYEDLKNKFGVQPLVISSKRPAVQDPITIVSGYFKSKFACHIDAFIYKMKEDQWTWRDSIRYSQPGCETGHGTSGSPIINSDTYEIVGINNTGNDDGAKCTMDNPCEIDQDGKITVRKHASYGQETYWIYGCLTQDRQIDINISGCQLNPTVKDSRRALKSYPVRR